VSSRELINSHLCGDGFSLHSRGLEQVSTISVQEELYAQILMSRGVDAKRRVPGQGRQWWHCWSSSSVERSATSDAPDSDPHHHRLGGFARPAKDSAPAQERDCFLCVSTDRMLGA